MASRLNVHFSSQTPEWSTPDDLFGELNEIFHFDLDACASRANAKCQRFFTKEQDALTRRWRGTVWMNPPYGREIAKFMRKAYEESLAGASVVCLVPSRTDTDWWHRFARRGQVRAQGWQDRVREVERKPSLAETGLQQSPGHNQKRTGHWSDLPNDDPLKGSIHDTR